MTSSITPNQPATNGQQSVTDSQTVMNRTMARLGTGLRPSNGAFGPAAHQSGSTESHTGEEEPTTAKVRNTAARMTAQQARAATNASAILNDSDAFAALNQTKAQILNSASLAVLAQANQSPQDVLTLFR